MRKGIIHINDYYFKYTSVFVINGLTLNIKEGECLGLLGSNGSGKTTLINCILGELDGKGDINVLGYRPNISNVEFKKNLGVVLDNDLLIDYLTLKEFLWFVGKSYDIKDDILSKRIDYWLRYFHLENHKERILKYFSHGMRKKTQIIAAILHNPRILIVDEPTNGLDVEMIFNFKELITELKKTGITILISTHHLDFVEDVCDSVAIIENGKIYRNLNMQDISKDSNLESVFLDGILKKDESSLKDRCSHE